MITATVSPKKFAGSIYQPGPYEWTLERNGFKKTAGVFFDDKGNLLVYGKTESSGAGGRSVSFNAIRYNDHYPVEFGDQMIFSNLGRDWCASDDIEDGVFITAEEENALRSVGFSMPPGAAMLSLESDRFGLLGGFARDQGRPGGRPLFNVTIHGPDYRATPWDVIFLKRFADRWLESLARPER